MQLRDAPVDDARVSDASVAAPLVVLVGTTSGTVRGYSVDDMTGAVTLQKISSVGGNPSFIAMDTARRIVYLVDEDNAALRSYTFDPRTYGLSLLGNERPTAASPTHLSLAPGNKFLLVAHYGGDSAAIHGINADGSIGAPISTVPSGDRSHQALTNPSGGWMFVPVLGAGTIAQYSLSSTGSASPNGTASPPPAAGPRHLAFRPDEAFAYGINETATSITAYRFDTTTGMLAASGTTDLLAPGSPASTGAEVVVHPSGRWVYGSVRGANTIVTLTSDASTGALSVVERTPALTTLPRSFGLDPTGGWLFVGSQDGPLLATFRIASDGTPDVVGTPFDVGATTIFVGAFRVP